MFFFGRLQHIHENSLSKNTGTEDAAEEILKAVRRNRENCKSEVDKCLRGSF